MQNKTHLGVFFFLFSLLRSALPAVIVIAEIILQDLRDRTGSRLIRGPATFLKCSIIAE